MSKDRAETPEAFTYVCVATGNTDMLLQPAYHIGWSGVKNIIIAVATAKFPTESDRRQAIEPAERLKVQLEARGYTLGKSLDYIVANPDSLLEWSKVAERAKELGLPVIANLTGGPKQATFGLDDALRATGMPYLRAFIPKYGDGTTLASSTEPFREWRVAPRETVPLATIFDARGYELLEDGDAKQKTRRFWEINRGYADGLANKVWPNGYREPFDDRARDALALCNFANDATQDYDLIDFDAALRPRSLAAHDASVAMLTDLLGVHGEKSPLQGVRTRNRLWKGMVTGIWLELAILYLLRREHNRPDIRFRHSVEWRRNGVAMNEMDILICKGDKLHLVEVKQSTAVNLKTQTQMFTKLGAIKSDIGGNPVSAWFVAPFLIPDDTQARMLRTKAENAGVTLLMGPTAIAGLVDGIRGLG